MAIYGVSLYGVLYGNEFETKQWTDTDYINYRDFNRIEGNIEILQGIIAGITEIPTLQTLVHDRDNYSFEYADSLSRIESNISALKDAFFEPLDWETPKTTWVTIDPFSYVDANRIENNIQRLKTMSEKITDEWEFCGAIYCGQVFNLGGI